MNQIYVIEYENIDKVQSTTNDQSERSKYD